MLKEAGFDVLYLHPLDRVFNAEVEDQDVKTAFLNLVKQSLEDERWGRLALAVFDLARKLLEKRRRKLPWWQTTSSRQSAWTRRLCMSKAC
jgi:hypothetical protein